MNRLAAFVRLSRFKFLYGSIVAGALGTSVAAYERGFSAWIAYALAQSALTAAHQMTHYANEFFDQETDALASRTAFSGGSGVLVDGLLAPRVAVVAAAVCALASSAAVAALFATHRTVAGALAAACLVLAWAYSAPPVRLLARGLGEFDTALVIGILAPLCAYAAQTGTVDLRALASGIPAAAAMFAMMMSVEVPDMTADGATGKRNLVVRFGAPAGAVFAYLALGAVAGGVALSRAFGAPPAFAWLECVALVPAIALCAEFAKIRRRAPFEPASLAGRGVATFVAVSTCAALGYVVALR